MQRVTRSSAAAALPLPPAAPGTPGYFAKPDPVAGVPATIPGYEWFNGVQEELVAELVDAGLTPDAAVLTQVRQAIRRLAGGNVATIAATTTLTADHAGLVLASAAAGNVTLTLPAANAAGGRPLRLTISRTDSAANTLTIQRAGTNTLNGLTSGTLPVGATVNLVSDGVSAWIVAGGAGLREVQSFLASGKSTVPWWARRAKAEVWAAGGAGGGSASSNFPGGGGGPGAYGAGVYPVTPGQTIAVTVGTGTAGANGGSSSFGSHLSCTGGVKGGEGTASAVGGGGASGTATGAQVAPRLGNGLSGIVFGGGPLEGGMGAAGFGGTPVRAVGSAGAGFNANPGARPGGGASGCTQSTAPGGAGQVIVEYLP